MAARLLRPRLAAPVAALTAALALGAWSGWHLAGPERRQPATVASVQPAAAVHGSALTDEAIRLYAAGQFARACARFSQAAEGAPERAALRADVVQCFEGWGWHVLREGRPEEAMLLFGRGLQQSPETGTLLRGLGLAAVHAGRTEEALASLERSVALEPDPEVRLLLAHVYDHRDEPRRALAHLRAVLERDPGHAAARRLLDKVERERAAESNFQREITPHFTIKFQAGRDGEARRAIVALLETAHARVTAQLGGAPPERVGVILYEHEEFRRITGAHGWVTGLFDGKIRLPVGGALPPGHELERLIVHEYAHVAIHHLSRGRAPRWLHEGLAQALEGAGADPLLRVPGSPTLAGIEALLADGDALRARTGYELALWVVHDLLDRGGMPAMRELMSRLGRGEPLAAAVPAVYGLRLSQLEFQWRRVLGG